MFEPQQAASPAAQIFSLDVTALSDKLDISEEELLAGLQGQRSSSSPDKDAASSGAVRRRTSHAADPPPYVACLVVSLRSSLRALKRHRASVLELTVRRLFEHRHCARLLVCVTDPRLNAEVEALVRACRRSANATNATPIDILHGDQDDVSAVRHACMYADATVSPTASSSGDTSPFVILRVDARVFDVETVDELVHQQQNASILTDGLTSAVVLADGGAPVGLWVCSMGALLDHCEVSEMSAKKLFGPEHHDDAHEGSIDAWLPWVLGTLHCETVLATAEFNWEQVSDNGRALAYRFEPILAPLSNQAGGDDDDNDVGASTVEFAALAAIQAELASDGISAALFPVPTSVVFSASEAPASAIDMATDTPRAALDERSPLLSSCSRAATVLSDIDLETTQPAPASVSSDANAQAYLIHVADTGDTSSSVPPELIFALPDDLSQLLSTGDMTSKLSSLEDSDLAPVLRVRRRSDRLPSSVTQITLEAVILEQPAPTKHGEEATRTARRVSVVLHVQKQVPLVGYLILVSALCAVSSQGAVLDLLVGVPPLLKLFWRVSGVSLALFPFATVSMYRKGVPRLAREKRVLALVCVLAYAAYNAAFLVALSLTSIGHVYIFANSHSLLLVAGKLLAREPLSALELLGASLGFSGGVVTTLDGAAAMPATTPAEGASRHEPTRPSPLGDLVAFTGAFGGVAYLLSAKKLRAALGVRVFLFWLTTGVALVLLPVLLVNHARLGINLSEPTHATQGLLGWVHHLDIELYLVLVGSVCGTMGFIAALKYFDPLVVSVTMLTEPVVATVLSIFVGVERVPGWPTLLGGLCVIGGCLLVLLATHRTSHKIDVSHRLVKTPFTSAATVLRAPEATHASRRSSASGASSSSSSSRVEPRGAYGSLA